MTFSVVWSLEAIEEFDNIYEYWILKNNSDKFSKKLWILTNSAIQTIRRNPELGVKTNNSTIRMRLVAQNYYLIYRIKNDLLEILKFWDVRQNPIKNQFK